MYTSRRKIQKDQGVEPSEFEDLVAQDIYINSAAQIDVSGNRKAVVIYVPYRLQKAFRKIHLRLVGELEKKFSGKHVVLIAARRILHPPKRVLLLCDPGPALSQQFMGHVGGHCLPGRNCWKAC
ncbi:40S ribosomal protein S7 [Vitis vinifera]|uniref:40S ribosomal protein S7 n=1 Tax=Vitis vinifera TaxID=29760 RepID=A0A438ENF7_VITVI|nr:40S ribosomal protein S7 [Vitis vinifera]